MNALPVAEEAEPNAEDVIEPEGETKLPAAPKVAIKPKRKVKKGKQSKARASTDAAPAEEEEDVDMQDASLAWITS